MTIDRLCVVSLDRTPERYAAFLRHNPDLPVERFAAVDGRSLNRGRCIAEGLITAANLYTPGALGCLASHVSLWRRAMVQDRPVHVAEDDALFRCDFLRRASDCLASLGAWDVVLWGWNFDWPLAVRLAPGLGTTVLQGRQEELEAEWRSFATASIPPVPVRLLSAAGTGAYSISPRGARLMIDLSLPVSDRPAPYALDPGMVWANTGTDVEMSRHYAGLDAYVTLPPLAAAINDRTASTISNA